MRSTADTVLKIAQDFNSKRCDYEPIANASVAFRALISIPKGAIMSSVALIFVLSIADFNSKRCDYELSIGTTFQP